MSTLEDLVRRSFAAHEHEAPTSYDLAARVRRGRRRRTQRGLAAGASLAAVGVVLGVTVVLGGSPATRPVPGVSPPPPVPAGMKALGYRGVEMDVPDDFQQNGCRGEAADLYDVGDGVHLTVLCISPKNIPLRTFVRIHKAITNPGSEYDQHYATTPTTVDGAPAHEGTAPARYGQPPTSVLVLDEQQLVLSVQSADPHTRERLMATGHLIGPVDRNGCAVHISDLDPPATTRTGSALVPGNPTSITVCSYADSWIRDSHTVAGAELQSLADALNALPPGQSHNPSNGPNCQEPQEGLLLRIAYSDRVLEEVARIETCGGYYIGDQHGTGRATFDITTTLLRDVIFDGGYPSPGVLQPG